MSVVIERADAGPGAPAYWEELPERLPGASPFVLWEWTRYKLTVTPANAGLQVWTGDTSVTEIGRGLFLFSFENSLGTARLCFTGAVVPDLQVEVLSRKLGTPGERLSYPRLFRQLVREVAQTLLELPFATEGSTAHVAGLTGAPAGPLFTLHFLRQHGEALAAALQAIGHTPHRVLAREEALLPAARVRRVDVSALRWGLSHPGHWVPAAPGVPAWVVQDGSAYVPGRLLLERAEETFDTPENRFVKHFVHLLLRACGAALALAWQAGAGEPVRRALVRVQQDMQAAAGWPWLAEVGELHYLPVSSQVLLRQDGYRELFDLYRRYLLASAPFADLDQSIAARDAATLYEYWCFFRLVRLLAASLGEAELHLEADATGALAWGVAARFAGAPLRLVFNRSFRGGQGSYSLGLRPDFVLLGVGGTPELVFDAKFRLTAPPYDLDDPDQAARYPQASDIYKMHTYRDALGVRAAVALYPGTEAVFYATDRRRRQGLTVAMLLGEPDLAGVGAIPLHPREETHEEPA